MRTAAGVGMYEPTKEAIRGILFLLFVWAVLIYLVGWSGWEGR